MSSKWKRVASVWQSSLFLKGFFFVVRIQLFSPYLCLGCVPQCKSTPDLWSMFPCAIVRTATVNFDKQQMVCCTQIYSCIALVAVFCKPFYSWIIDCIFNILPGMFLCPHEDKCWLYDEILVVYRIVPLVPSDTMILLWQVINYHKEQNEWLK